MHCPYCCLDYTAENPCFCHPGAVSESEPYSATKLFARSQQPIPVTSDFLFVDMENPQIMAGLA